MLLAPVLAGTSVFWFAKTPVDMGAPVPSCNVGVRVLAEPVCRAVLNGELALSAFLALVCVTAAPLAAKPCTAVPIWVKNAAVVIWLGLGMGGFELSVPANT